jgi:hypothetical protein
MAGFLDPLMLEYIDGRFYKVTAPFNYAVGYPDGKTIVHVPAGFITDFASIPQIFWNIIPPTGFYGKAAVIHDFLYKTANINGMTIVQKYADDVLNEGMVVLASAWILEHGRTEPGYPYMPRGELKTLTEREVIYRGVRIGGWFTWRNYRKQELKS